MKDFEVTAKLRNNQLKARRLERGMNLHEFSEAAGVTYLAYSSLENLKDPPVYPRDSVRGIKQGAWRPVALKVAQFYGCPPEDLFPDTIRHVQRTEIVATFDLEQLPLAALKQVPALLPSPEDALLQGETEEQLNSVLDSLSPRHRTVIECRFGLNGREALTLEETGEILNVSRERVRQMEAQSIVKLRKYANEDGTFSKATPFHPREPAQPRSPLEEAALLEERARKQHKQAREAASCSQWYARRQQARKAGQFVEDHDRYLSYARRNEAKAQGLRALAAESSDPAHADRPGTETGT